MILYGRNSVLEAAKGRRAVLRAWVSREQDVALFPADLDAVVADTGEIQRLCGSPDHQGFACEADQYPYGDAGELLAGDDALVVAIDQIQDPHNLGAICRSAECAGASGVVIPERRSAQITPAVCRVSAGAVEHLAVARVRNLADYLRGAKNGGAWIYGADARGPAPYTQPDYRGRVVLVLGSEGKGLRRRVADSCDQIVSLPMCGRLESMNVSAAASVLLFEAVRQRTN